MTATDLLREAARLMRERATAATTGPWYADGFIGVYAYGKPDEDGCPQVFTDHKARYDDIQHIGAFASPAVALAVADWLDEDAGHLEDHITAWTAPSRGVDDPPALAWNNPERLASLIEHHFGRPLAVARAYLGSES